MSAAISKWYKNGITQVWGCIMTYPISNGRCLSTTEFHRLESGTASNRYQCDIVRASIGMPISNLIKTAYLRRLFRFRSGYLSTVELLVSFQQTGSVFAISKQHNDIFVWRLQIWISICIYCRMTDVELAVESYLSISLATYLSDIEWLASFRQRNYMGSISIRLWVLYRPYIRITISKRYHNGI